MSENPMCDGRNFEHEIRRYIGQTVTIYTTSGGESGSGFTGVVLSANREFVRLVTSIGTAPGWAMGNMQNDYDYSGGYNDGRVNRNRGFALGSITDIPTNRISAFVHNAV